MEDVAKKDGKKSNKKKVRCRSLVLFVVSAVLELLSLNHDIVLIHSE